MSEKIDIFENGLKFIIIEEIKKDINYKLKQKININPLQRWSIVFYFNLLYEVKFNKFIFLDILNDNKHLPFGCDQSVLNKVDKYFDHFKSKIALLLQKKIVEYFIDIYIKYQNLPNSKDKIYLLKKLNKHMSIISSSYNLNLNLQDQFLNNNIKTCICMFSDKIYTKYSLNNILDIAEEFSLVKIQHN